MPQTEPPRGDGIAAENWLYLDIENARRQAAYGIGGTLLILLIFGGIASLTGIAFTFCVATESPPQIAQRWNETFILPSLALALLFANSVGFGWSTILGFRRHPEFAKWAVYWGWLMFFSGIVGVALTNPGSHPSIPSVLAALSFALMISGYCTWSDRVQVTYLHRRFQPNGAPGTAAPRIAASPTNQNAAEVASAVENRRFDIIDRLEALPGGYWKNHRKLSREERRHLRDPEAFFAIFIFSGFIYYWAIGLWKKAAVVACLWMTLLGAIYLGNSLIGIEGPRTTIGITLGVNFFFCSTVVYDRYRLQRHGEKMWRGCKLCADSRLLILCLLLAFAWMLGAALIDRQELAHLLGGLGLS